MSLNTNQSQNNTAKEKKHLKLAQPFENNTQQSFPQPYYPQYQYYGQSQYPYQYNDYPNYNMQQTPYNQINSNLKQQTNQQYQPDKPPQHLQDIQPQQSQIQSIAQKPQQQSTVPKEKKKLKLTTQEFKVDLTIEQQLEKKRKQEEEQKKKEEELKQKEEEERKKKECLPKSYTKQQIEEFLEGFDATKFMIFNEEAWKILAERKFDSINQIAHRSYNKKESTRPLQSPQLDKKFSKAQEQKKAVEFNRGTDAKADQLTSKEPKIIVVRQVEDISVKQRKEKMKTQVNWLEDQKTEDASKVWEKEVKFKLNQLAPDNFQSISKIIINLLVDNREQATYLAERIIEKSQLEPKYRYLYTSLCSLLVQDPRLQDQNQKNPQKKKSSVFKKALLLRVQQIFESRNTAGQKNQEQSQEQKEYEHMLRKNKIMGNVRFIGDLYQQNILPQQAVVGAITELLAEYLSTYTRDQENEEENLEGLVELLDQIGQKYKDIPQTQAQVDLVTTLFNGQQIPKKQVEIKFQEIFIKGIPQDVMFLILELLKSKYKLTQMVEIKIVNLIDRRQQGWKEIIHQKGESAKGANQLRQEDEEKQGQSYQSGRQNNKRNTQTQSQQQVVYIAKQSQQSAQERDFDEAEFKEYIKGTFNLELIEQTDRLKDEIKRYVDFQKAQLILFTQFFQIMLQPKQTNVSRAQIVFELLCLKEANENSIKEALQSILKNEDFLFNLIESPKGKELFVDIIACFLNEEDLDSLKKLYIKPPEELEEYINFLGDVMSDLESRFSDKDRSIIDLLNKYLKEIHLDQIQIQ